LPIRGALFALCIRGFFWTLQAFYFYLISCAIVFFWNMLTRRRSSVGVTTLNNFLTSPQALIMPLAALKAIAFPFTIPMENRYAFLESGKILL
jgi:hypothetical protein